MVVRKTTHWIWFIYPIPNDLGKSETAQYYAIEDLVEAKAFIEHPYLGNNYLKYIKAILVHADEDIEVILGSRINKWKLRVSLILFEKVNLEKPRREVLSCCVDHFYAGKQCVKILGLLFSSQRKFKKISLSENLLRPSQSLSRSECV